MVRPRAPQPVLNPSQSCCLGRSLSTPHSSTTTRVGAVLRHFRGDRFPRSAQEPEPGSRHLHAGHHPGSKQVIPWARPEVRIRPRFRCRLNHFDTSSVVHSRSSSWLAPDPIKPGLFRNAHHPGPAFDRRSLRWFAASPCRAAAEGHTSISCTASQSATTIFYIAYLLCSWRTSR